MTYRSFPVDAPGLPFIGSDFLEMARSLGDPGLDLEYKKNGKLSQIRSYGTKIQELVDAALFGRGNFHLNVAVSNDETISMPVVCGHLWARKKGDMASSGPVPAEIMVISSCPEESEVYNRVLYQGDAAKLLLETLRKFGAKDIGDWYVTNVMKTVNPGGDGANLKAGWIASQVHLLHQEIKLVKPKYILLLGSEAVKALFGKAATVRKYEADVASYYVDLRRSASEEPNGYEAQVMVCNNPRSVIWSQEMLPAFEKGIRRFLNFLDGYRPDVIEDGIEQRIIDTEQQLRDLCKEIDATTETRIIAMDAEWNGEHPQNSNAYLRTIQLSWHPMKAAVIKLRAAGGSVCFQTTTHPDAEKVVAEILTEFMQDKRACGHYFNADMEWFEAIGLNLRKQFAAPDTWQECKTKGGLDTALMAHAYDEVTDLSLTALTLLYTTIPRYDLELNEWKRKYCSQNKLKASELEGYGDCPDEILLPYAALDALATYRLAVFFLEKLDSDPYGNNCWPGFWVSQKAAVGVLEMKMTGLLLDSKRVDELSSLYMEKSAELANKIRRLSNWPEFNPNSVFHVRELLYGTKYNGKPKQENGKRPRLRPRMARSVATIPILDTSKRPVPWQEIMEEGREDKHYASTNRMVMGILSHSAKNLEVRRHGRVVRRNVSDLVNAMRDYKFVSHTMRAALRPPVNTIIEDDEEENVYEAGLAASACDDGYVRTTIYQTKETGRWSSARPPLQNLCFDMETQILTQRGWVYFDELEDFDMVAQYEPDEELIEFVKPQEIQSFEYNGDMVRIVAEDYDMLVTPNHRLLMIEPDGEDHFENTADNFYAGLGDFVCVDLPSFEQTFVSTEDAKVSLEPYDGTVNCVTVPSSFVLVRRNGKAYISGNSKRRETDYKRILKDEYRYPVRSVLRATPGWVLVEADYVGAELFVMAAMSGDEQMLEHAKRNQLPEDHPDFYDIHSNVCVLAFNLDCPPTKSGLASIGKKHLRDVGKAVAFGLAYGRGAKAIATASKEEGVDASVEDAQQIIDTIFAMYPGLLPFFEDCRSRVGLPNRLYENPPGWLRGPFGRLRRFPVPRNKKQAGDYQRQAQNFPVQGAVADAVSLAVANLYDYRENLRAQGVTPEELDYRLCLQIHDAIVLMVPAYSVAKVVEEIFPLCMREMVPLYPTALDGSPLGTGPYYFGMDITVQQSWGVTMNPDECLAIGMDPKYAGWTKVEDGFQSAQYKNKIWIPNRGFIESSCAK